MVLQAASTINGSGNPFSGTNGCSDENYMTIFSGTLNVAAAGTYEFSVDGDDAIDLTIDGVVQVGWYGGHGGWHGGGFYRGWGGPRFYGRPVYFGDGYGDCYVKRLVPTPWGYRYRLVNRCY